MIQILEEKKSKLTFDCEDIGTLIGLMYGLWNFYSSPTVLNFCGLIGWPIFGRYGLKLAIVGCQYLYLKLFHHLRGRKEQL